MEQAIECCLAITSLIIGASHLLRPGDWCEAYWQLHRLGRPGAIVNGAMSLLPGAIILAGHRDWTWPGVIVTIFGCLLIAKAMACFLWPERALRSMEYGARTPRGFIAGGLIFLALSSWLWYRLWQLSATP